MKDLINRRFPLYTLTVLLLIPFLKIGMYEIQPGIEATKALNTYFFSFDEINWDIHTPNLIFSWVWNSLIGFGSIAQRLNTGLLSILSLIFLFATISKKEGYSKSIVFILFTVSMQAWNFSVRNAGTDFLLFAIISSLFYLQNKRKIFPVLAIILSSLISLNSIITNEIISFNSFLELIRLNPLLFLTLPAITLVMIKYNEVKTYIKFTLLIFLLLIPTFLFPGFQDSFYLYPFASILVFFFFKYIYTLLEARIAKIWLLVLGAITTSIMLLSVIANNFLGAPNMSVGSIRTAMIIEEFDKDSFLYICHASCKEKAYNSQLDWYLKGWMSNKKDSSSVNLLLMEKDRINLNMIYSLKNQEDKLLVYYFEDNIELAKKVVSLISESRPVLEQSGNYVIFGTPRDRKINDLMVFNYDLKERETGYFYADKI